MKRRQFVQCAAGALSAAAAGCASAPRRTAAGPSRPNIVILLADDMGYGDLSCLNPESKIPTPNMDRLSREGISFTDAHSPCAVCTPTRYGILTGRYCWRSRLKRGVLWGWSDPLIEPERTTIASMLKRRGYRTGAVGKWHLGLGWQTRDGAPNPENGENIDYSKPLSGGPTELGFDYFFGIPASLDMEPYCYVENDRLVEAPTAHTERVEYPAFYRAGPIAPGFEFNQVLPDFTNKSIDFIDDCVQNHPNQPFFLYLPFASPHTPWVPNDFVHQKSRAGVYGDFVYETDWAVGQVLDALERNGIADDTLVILSSDNGAHIGHIGDHNNGVSTGDNNFGHSANYIYRGQKADAWDGGHRVPFIARWPGRIEAGAENDETICQTDLMATIADITGIRLREGEAPDSYNIRAVLEGGAYASPARGPVIVQSSRGVFCIRDGEWKLIMGRGSGGFSNPRTIEPGPGEPEGQLYHMGRDPGEQRNLYSDYPEIVARLEAEFNAIHDQGHSPSL